MAVEGSGAGCVGCGTDCGGRQGRLWRLQERPPEGSREDAIVESVRGQPRKRVTEGSCGGEGSEPETTCGRGRMEEAVKSGSAAGIRRRQSGPQDRLAFRCGTRHALPRPARRCAFPKRR